MARDGIRGIPQERIDAGELTEEEIAFLRSWNKLPADYLQADEEAQATPKIEAQGGIVEDEETEEDYEDGWNNDQRRAELQDRGLSIEGNKSVLIARLRRSDVGELDTADYSDIDD